MGKGAPRKSLGFMRICFLLLFLALSSAYGQIVSVASYNLRNWLTTDRMVEGVYQPKYPKPEAEKAAVIQVLKEANADILTLQEIGDPSYLAELQQLLKKAGLDYPYRAHLQAADPERHTAILSRLPLVQVEGHRQLRFDYFGRRSPVLRGVLEAQLELPEGRGRWRIFVVHLKSRMTERSEDPDSLIYRTAEASAIRLMIEKRTPAMPYLVAGDFNDTPRSRPLKRFLKKGDKTLTVMLSPKDSRKELWTHRWEAESSYSRIDYLLASPSLARTLVPGSERIIDTPAASVASDHRLIMASFDLSGLNPQSAGGEL
jgi:endonuclease/exonuclease/phosphatase family metal-dependent hydrolase